MSEIGQYFSLSVVDFANAELVGSPFNSKFSKVEFEFMTCEQIGDRDDCATQQEVNEFLRDQPVVIHFYYSDTYVDFSNQDEPIQVATSYGNASILSIYD